MDKPIIDKKKKVKKNPLSKGQPIEEFTQHHLVKRRLHKLRKEYKEKETRSKNNIRDTNKLLKILEEMNKSSN